MGRRLAEISAIELPLCYHILVRQFSSEKRSRRLGDISCGVSYFTQAGGGLINLVRLWTNRKYAAKSSLSRISNLMVALLDRARSVYKYLRSLSPWIKRRSKYANTSSGDILKIHWISLPNLQDSDGKFRVCKSYY